LATEEATLYLFGLHEFFSVKIGH